MGWGLHRETANGCEGENCSVLNLAFIFEKANFVAELGGLFVGEWVWRCRFAVMTFS